MNTAEIIEKIMVFLNEKPGRKAEIAKIRLPERMYYYLLADADNRGMDTSERNPRLLGILIEPAAVNDIEFQTHNDLIQSSRDAMIQELANEMHDASSRLISGLPFDTKKIESLANRLGVKVTKDNGILSIYELNLSMIYEQKHD
ncbi:MAG: hypothetical protein E6Q83_03565 [Thiothrix sp.]|nr:MAG: hypothetical protein E6Q83_03565 [Thiothrix sp.]